jgi:tetratricopeptide (TPR) repeat protein
MKLSGSLIALAFGFGAAAAVHAQSPEETALARRDCRVAAEGYAAAAEKARDANLAKRATEVARQCEHWPARMRAAERWRALAPRDPAALQAVALAALGLHQLDAARSALKALFALPESKPDVLIAELVPVAREESGAYPTVVALTGSIDFCKLAPATLVAIGEQAFEAFDFERARTLARQALDRDPKSAAAHALIARTHASVGEAAPAIEAARAAMQLDPQGQAFARAETLASLDRLEETRQELDRLRAEESSRAEAERRLALLAFNSGDFKEAERRFSERLARGESSGEAVFYLGLLAERREDSEQALRAYEMLAQSGLGKIARPRAATVLIRQGERGEALTLLDDHIAENAEDAVEFTIVKAQVLAAGDAADEGAALLDAALERYPDHPTLAYEQSVMLERAGREREAVGMFERLLRRRPDDPVVQNALGYTLADHDRDLRRAEQLIRRALKATPDHPAVLDSYGWVRFRRGDAAEALRHLERAYAISGDPEIAAHWGEVLWAGDRQTEARKVWAQALARNPDAEPLKATVQRFTKPAAPDSPPGESSSDETARDETARP